MRHRNDGGGFLATRFAGDAPELRLEETVLLGCRGPGTFGQHSPQPWITARRAAAFVLPRATIVARTHSGPRTQIFGRRKLLHVTSGFGQNRRRAALLDPGQRL